MAIYNGKVRGESLNLCQTASTSATVLASIPNNTSTLFPGEPELCKEIIQ